jgi:hypothetical protein
VKNTRETTMCDEGCYTWTIRANPEANENKIQPGVPFWLETGKPCGQCVEREFSLLYNKCGYGNCKGVRVGPQGGCERHQEHFSQPMTYVRPERPENAKQAGRITPYHRSKRRKKQDEKQDEELKAEDPRFLAHLNSNLAEIMGNETGAITDEGIERMAHNILHAWDD